MNKYLKIGLNIFIFILLCFAVFFKYEIRRRYWLLIIAVAGATLLFNFIRNTKWATLFAISGIGLGCLISAHAFNFMAYANAQRSKFDLETAVTFEKKDFETILEESAHKNKPIFVEFYASWCGICLKFTETVLTDKEVGTEMNKAFISLKYDAEKGKGKIIAQKYGVSAYPTLLILNDKGVVLEKILGALNKNEIIALAQKYQK